MREIKFRVYSQSVCVMYTPEKAKSFGGNLYNIPMMRDGILIPEVDDIYMQFTGAYDRDGNEIYDGDIIEFDAKEWGDDVTNKHQVYWDEYQHGWSFGGGSQQGDMEWRIIIGNIYENPELLCNH